MTFENKKREEEEVVLKADVAEKKKKEAEEYLRRANSFKNIYDKETHYMRAKKTDGSFKIPFDPLSVANQGYIEGNAWKYSLYVPQDVKGFIHLLGGKEKLITWLDSLFTFDLPDKYFGESEDVTKVGMIGNYVHGNEPSHHVPYMYNFAGAPWKTQERIHQIVNTMYKPEPHGLCGNDDCGQMSAWYLLSAMGFHPVSPVDGVYLIGSPLFDKLSIRLDPRYYKGGTFTVVAHNNSAKNPYIQSAKLNGQSLNRAWIRHQEVVNGGTLEFEMGPEPNRSWGSAPTTRPPSMSASAN